MVGDITYIPTWEGWVYLATVIDCHTKAVIGWAMDDHYKTPLIEKAMRMAARNYDLAPGAIFHSDYAELCVKLRDCALACVGGVA
jgi:putative transposase